MVWTTVDHAIRINEALVSIFMGSFVFGELFTKHLEKHVPCSFKEAVFYLSIRWGGNNIGSIGNKIYNDITMDVVFVEVGVNMSRGFVIIHLQVRERCDNVSALEVLYYIDIDVVYHPIDQCGGVAVPTKGCVVLMTNFHADHMD